MWLKDLITDILRSIGTGIQSTDGSISDAKSERIFWPFVRLPAEIRLQIWEHFMRDEATGLPLINHSETRVTTGPDSPEPMVVRVFPFPELVSPLLSVNHESRAAALKFYPLRIPVLRLPGLMYPHAKTLICGRELWDLCKHQVDYVLAYARRASKPVGFIYLNTECSVLVSSSNEHWTSTPLALTLWQEAILNRNRFVLVVKRFLLLRSLGKLCVPPYNDTSLAAKYITAPLANVTEETKVRLPSATSWAEVRQCGLSTRRSLEAVLDKRVYTYAELFLDSDDEGTSENMDIIIP